ncbi:MAG: HTH domain-containing protein [Candidatus Paceibacterota bacterium]
MITEERIAKLTSAVYKVTDLFPEKEPLKLVIRRESLDVLFSCTVLLSKPNLGQNEKFIKKAVMSAKALVHYFNLAELQSWADPRNFSILKAEYSELIFWLEDQSLSLEIEAKNTLLRIDSAYDIPDSDVDIKKRIEGRRQLITEREKDAIDYAGKKRISSAESIDSEEGLEGVVISPQKELGDRKELGIEQKKEKTVLEVMTDVVIDYEELSSIQLKTLEILQNKGFLKASQISKHFEDTSERSVRREIKELKDKSIIVAKGSGRSTFYEINHVY